MQISSYHYILAPFQREDVCPPHARSISSPLGSSSTTLKFRFRGVSMLIMCPFATAESQNHPEQMRWEGTSGSHLVQPPFSSRGSWSRVPSRLLNISKGGDCTMSLSNLFQCSITLMVKKIFLSLNRMSCTSIDAHCLLFLPREEHGALPSLLPMPAGIYSH